MSEVIALVLTVALAQSATEVPELRLEPFIEDEGHEVDAVEVVALSMRAGFAAIRVTQHIDEGDEVERGASIDCHYPGMKAHPKSGVTLLLWSFAENKVTKSFEVNRAATSRGQCTRQRDAKRALADAKAEMAVLGLDFSKRPQPVAHLIESREEKVKEDGREDVRVTHFSHDTAIFTQLYDTVAGISNASVFVEGTKLVILQTSWTNVGKHFFNFYALTPVLELPGPR